MSITIIIKNRRTTDRLSHRSTNRQAWSVLDDAARELIKEGKPAGEAGVEAIERVQDRTGKQLNANMPQREPKEE